MSFYLLVIPADRCAEQGIRCAIEARLQCFSSSGAVKGLLAAGDTIAEYGQNCCNEEGN
jgi:hypothetical protein